MSDDENSRVDERARKVMARGGGCGMECGGFRQAVECYAMRETRGVGEKGTHASRPGALPHVVAFPFTAPRFATFTQAEFPSF